MRKIGLIIGTFLVSLNCYADVSKDMSNALKNSTKQAASGNKNLTIMYGGQDISRPIIATANESFWSGQPTLIG